MKKIYFILFAMMIFAMGAKSQQLPENWTIATSLISVEKEMVNVNHGDVAMHVNFTSAENQDIRSAVFEVTGDESFTYSLDVFDNDNAGRVRLCITWSSGNQFIDSYSVDSEDWQTLTFTGTIPAAATTAQILLRFYDVAANWDGDCDIIVDNAVFTMGGGENLIPNASFENWAEPVIPEYTIAEIQGMANASPYVGQQVTTGGIVTGVFASGYFIQDGSGAWNGIYVYNNTNNPLIGDDVTITGIVAEFNGKTEMTNISEYTVNSVDNELPAPVAVTTAEAASEMYEGVLVSLAAAECLVEDAGFGEWTVDDGSGAINIDDLMFAYTPVSGNVYDVTGVVDFANAAFKVLPRSADDIVNLGNPVANAIQHAIDNTTLVVEPNPVTVYHGGEAVFNINIDYAVFSGDLPAGYYVDAHISFDSELPAGIVINIVHTGYGIDVNYPVEAGASFLSLSQMLGTEPALLWGHSGLSDVWSITVFGLGMGNYEAEIASFADDFTDGPYSTFTLASDNLVINVVQNQTEALADVVEGTQLVINPETQTIETGAQAELAAVVTYPETINPILNEYVMDAVMAFEEGLAETVTVHVNYSDNQGANIDLGAFTIDAETEWIYLSELIEAERTALLGHAGLVITWSLVVEGLPEGIHNFSIDVVTNKPESFATEYIILASGDASVTVEDEIIELQIVNQSDDIIKCEGEEVNLFVEVNITEGVTYSWTLNEEALEFETASIQVSAPGVYVCTATTEGSSVVSEPINVSISVPMPYLGENASYCEAYEVVLAPGDFDSYNWGNDITTPTLTVTEAGEYSVTVTDAYGCTAESSVTIAFEEEITLDLGEDMFLCPDGSIHIQVLIPGTYLWSTEATSADILITEAGVYSVTVTQGTCEASDEIEIIAAENPEPFEFEVEEIFACDGSEVEIESPVTAASYLWSTGDETASITVTESGTYTLTIFNAAGCSANNDVTVNFVNYIIVSLGDDVLACPGDSVVLNPAIGAEWIWSDASVESTLTVGEAGVYSVTVTDAYGCSGSDEIEVAYRVAPEVNIGEDVTFCSGNTLELEAPVAVEYVWSTGDTLQLIEVMVSGSYSVTITDEFGCHNSDTMILTVLPSPLVDLGPDNTITEDQTIILSAYPGYASYLWFDESTDNTILISGQTLGVGDHLIWVRVIANNECETYDEMLLTVTEGIFVEPNLVKSVNIYPNPVKNMLNLNFGLLTGQKSVSVNDITGKTVLNIETERDFESINVAGLPAGLYVIRITAPLGSLQKTFVIE